jgi:hypothetical protein
VTFLEVAEGSKDILFMNNDLRQSTISLLISEKVMKNEVIKRGNITLD